MMVRKQTKKIKKVNSRKRTRKDVSDRAVFVVLILVILLGVVSLGVYLDASALSKTNDDNRIVAGVISLEIQERPSSGDNQQVFNNAVGED